MSDWTKRPRIGLDPARNRGRIRRGWFRGGLCSWPPRTAMTIMESSLLWWRHPPMLCRRTHRLVRPIYFRPMANPCDEDFFAMMNEAWRQCIR